MKRFFLAIGLALALPVAAQERQAEAADRLLRAAALLAEAETSRDKIKALTRSIRAYEAGLSALRGDVARLTLRERELVAALAEEETDLAALLAMMQTASRQTEVRAFLYPGSAPETIRAGLLAAEVLPVLEARAATVEAVLMDLQGVKAKVEAGQATLEEGWAGMITARTELAAAMLDRRRTRPDPSETDIAALQALVTSSQTLSALADALSSGPTIDLPGRDEAWSLPVAGAPVTLFDPAWAETGARPGWELSAPARALISSPLPATVRFSGEVPGNGHVMVLESPGGVLVVLAGFGDVFVAEGDVVSQDGPLGFLPPAGSPAQDNLNAVSDTSSLLRKETLYIEIRRDGAPVDPASVLTLDQQ